MDFNVSQAIIYILMFISLYFEIFLLVTFFEGTKKITENDDSGIDYKTVTIFVPCFNEEKTVIATIESLLDLDYPKDKLSIFVIDDGSTDGTWNVVQQFKNNPQIFLFKKENGGKWTALNLGLQHAQSELVGCLDADSFVDKCALKNIVKRFADKNVMAVTPAIRVHNPRTLIQIMQKAEYTLSMFIRFVFALLGSIFIAPGPFSIFKKEVFDKLGSYRHAHNTEDLEIALRMQTHGMKIDNAHDAFVYTVTPRTVRLLFRQRLRWIHGFLENMLDYRRLLFKKRHGNLSLFILPAAIISIFSALYFATVIVHHIIMTMIQKISEFSAINFKFNFQNWAIDWFYLHTESLFVLSVVLGALTISLILMGKYLADRKISFSKDVLFFILFYSFLAPWWLAKAVYNTLLSRKTAWR
ncbi:glycosyltransferase family 2 protein [Candidatus Falkowbacteria bacterium]|nr:glycosyltransferase family 2 protein [Candidatus Falkowbacteria bacterium]